MILSNGDDPRLDLNRREDPPVVELETAPVVAKTRSSSPSPAIAAVIIAVAGVGLFSMLNARRSAAETIPLTAPVTDAALSAPDTLQLAQAPAMQPPPPPPPTPTAAPQPAAAPTAAPTPTYTVAATNLDQRRRAPALIVDLGSGARPVPAVGAAAPAAAQVTAAADQAAANTPEAFAARLANGGDGDVAMAGPSIRDLGLVIPQGAIIPAVLETAINSDLPGYTRAVVSRDVRSFDGRTVLIPRGSRLVGQYKSALSMGQSRAFVIWTRVTRPDGVSVQISSPGTDALGRGGLEGEVDRHFFSRFGGSILLSVLNAGVAAIGGTPSTQIAIGSPGAANAAASSIQGDQVPPTVKVAQGEAIRIFVARDLDFSAVGPMR